MLKKNQHEKCSISVPLNSECTQMRQQSETPSSTYWSTDFFLVCLPAPNSIRLTYVKQKSNLLVAWGRGVEVRARCGLWIMTGAQAFSPRKPTKEISSQYRLEGARPWKNKRQAPRRETKERGTITVSVAPINNYL